MLHYILYENVHVRNINTGHGFSNEAHFFIGETAFSNLFMAGLDEDGRDLMIVSALSNNSRAEYDLEKKGRKG